MTNMGENKQNIKKHMIVPVSMLKFDKEKRIRQNYEHIDELLASMNKIGQIYDLLIDEHYNVRVGGSRYLAAVKGNWESINVEMRIGLSEDEWYLLEYHENARRKNLDPVEEALALANAKKIYEKLYPDTKKYVIAGKTGGRGRSQIAKDKMSLAIDDVQKSQREKEAAKKSFIAFEAKKQGISKRTVSRKLELADAIQDKMIGPDKIEKIRDREISPLKVMKEVKNKVKFKPDIVVKEKLPHYVCKNAQIIQCIKCGKKYILCKQELGREIIKVKPFDSPKCTHFVV